MWGRGGVHYEVVLKFVDAILAGRKGFTDIDGGDVVFDE
jgi:hypothetical protein